jgi:hypothetical protein
MTTVICSADGQHTRNRCFGAYKKCLVFDARIYCVFIDYA